MYDDDKGEARGLLHYHNTIMFHIIISYIIIIPLQLAISFPTGTRIPHITKSSHRQQQYYTTRHYNTYTTTRIQQTYGKGSEIWPECNEEPILLSSSFPSGIIPQFAKNLLEDTSISSSIINVNDTTAPQSTIRRRSKRHAVRSTLSHLLQSAATASSRKARSTEETTAISKGPALLALALLSVNCVDIQHVISVLGMSTYFIGLASWCRSPKQGTADETIVNMPSLPQLKGHVPTLVANPLGALTNSRAYRIWLRIGGIVSLLVPTIILTQLLLQSKFPTIKEWINVGSHITEIKRIIGGHMFLLCCQALSEALARTSLLPLPIRILIPVSYNTLRLSSLQAWVARTSLLPLPLKVLGIVNLLYWYANLFLFLIPIGVTRYLRAHFFCIEATEVIVRKGGEDSVGLLP